MKGDFIACEVERAREPHKLPFAWPWALLS